MIGMQTKYHVIRKKVEKRMKKENISLVVCTCKYSASGHRSTDSMQ